jgi:glutaminase
MQQYGGPQVIPQKIGVEPTGLPFNSKMALELYKDRSAIPGQCRRDRRGEPRQGK